VGGRLIDMERNCTKCFVISASSGAGKTTLVSRLIADRPDTFYNSVSDTTREKRLTEIDGRDYNFITISEFQSRIHEVKYLEWAKVHENFYGTQGAPLFDAMDKGKFPLLVIDVQGYFQVRKNIPYDRLCSIFIFPPNEEELIRRIKGRGDVDDRNLKIRLKNSKKEFSEASQYKYCLTNDNLEVAYSILKFIIEKEMGE